MCCAKPARTWHMCLRGSSNGFTIYDLRFTIYDLRFTVYDLRFTIGGLRLAIGLT